MLAAAIIVRIFSNCFANVYQKKLTNKNINPVFVNAITYLILTLLSLFLIIFSDFTGLTLSFWGWAAIVGLLGATGNGFLIKALEKGEISVLGPINAYKSIVGMIFGIFLLKEIPNIFGFSGMFLIIFGSYFILDTLQERFSFSLLKNKQIQYRFLALFFSAVEAVFIKKLILLSNILDTFIVWCFFGALFSLLMFKFSKLSIRKEFVNIKSLNILFFINIVFCIAIMQYSTNYVFLKMNVSYALALFQLSAIVSVFLGYKIFSEKNIAKKLFGSVIMVIGAVLIILFN